MTQVTVTIGQKPFHLACDEGQEDHVAQLARYFDNKVRDISRQVGHAPDNLLFLMASLTLIDQMAEYERDIESLRRQVDQYSKESSLHKAAKQAGDATMNSSLNTIAERLEQACSELSAHSA